MEDILSNSNNGQIEVWASYLQLYCETITDLLTVGTEENSKANDNCLNIREKDNEVYVDGLSKYKIENLADLFLVLAKGDENRTTAATNKNETSSRSHAVLMLTIIIRDEDVDFTNSGTYKQSSLVLVDLAGSER